MNSHITAMESILTQPVFQMSLLLFVALAGYLVASRINQSAVIGLILVGIVVGPSALGLITYTDFISVLANLGAVILLFVIGLEFKLSDIVALRNGVIAAVGVIITLDRRVLDLCCIRVRHFECDFHRDSAHRDEHRHHGKRPAGDGETPDQSGKSDHRRCRHR